MNIWPSAGMKCICIESVDPERRRGPAWIGHVPQKGERFTVIHVEGHYGLTFLTFAEIGPDCGFDANQYRPLVSPTLEQDVEAIKRGLDPIAMADLLLDEMDAASR